MAFAAQATPQASPGVVTWPLGVPSGALEVTVRRVVDGDKVYVDAADGLHQVLLAGVDAPETDECFFIESKKYLAKLIAKGATAYLEQSGSVDKYGSLWVRYLWLPGENGKKAVLINTKMVREGMAGFDDGQDSPKYFENLEKAELDARTKGKGLWDVCHTLHVSAASLTPEPTTPPKPTPTPRPIPTPTTVPAGWTPEEQRYLDSIVAITDVMGPSLTHFSDLMFAPNFGDVTWTIDVAVELFTWQDEYSKALLLNPPEVFSYMHSLFLEALRLYSDAADQFTYGFDHGDLASIESANSMINQATDLVTQANEELSRIKEVRGI